MSKPAFRPDWLVNLLNRWSKQELRLESNAMGYPSKCPGFSERTTGGYNHSDPFNFHAEDFRELVGCLEALKDEHLGQFTALMMCYKPWCIQALQGDGWPFQNSTYYDRLHRAHSYMAAAMDAKKAQREAMPG